MRFVEELTQTIRIKLEDRAALKALLLRLQAGQFLLSEVDVELLSRIIPLDLTDAADDNPKHILNSRVAINEVVQSDQAKLHALLECLRGWEGVERCNLSQEIDKEGLKDSFVGAGAVTIFYHEGVLYVLRNNEQRFVDDLPDDLKQTGRTLNNLSGDVSFFVTLLERLGFTEDLYDKLPESFRKRYLGH